MLSHSEKVRISVRSSRRRGRIQAPALHGVERKRDPGLPDVVDVLGGVFTADDTTPDPCDHDADSTW
jgi:hypothetical protein